MISVRNSFFLVDVPGTSGGTLRHALLPFADLAHPSGRYATVEDYRDLIGPSFVAFFSMCFVRNPFDWLVAQYEYIRVTQTHEHHQAAVGQSFLEFAVWYMEHEPQRQCDWITIEGARRVDYIGRFETFAEDAEALRYLLDLPCDLPPFEEPLRELHWSSYYDEVTREAVARHYWMDFAAFGYDNMLRAQPTSALSQLNDPDWVATALAQGAGVRRQFANGPSLWRSVRPEQPRLRLV